jgi:polyphosphate kinase 2 (PPK2 family)
MLEKVVLSQQVDKETYKTALLPYQVALHDLGLRLYEQKRLLVILYEGWDASGKGGSIKRLTERLDPRGYEVFPIAAPQGDDKNHHYLWRFWRRILAPDEKQVLIFDRSWYGRVLVERIEGFCDEPAWKRAYREINEFERQLAASGTILVKFWVHISKEEQLRRFEDRQKDPYRSWKLTDEDWRNRDKWDAYVTAVEEMLLKTSTITAPWSVVPGNDKYYARLWALREVVRVLGKALDQKVGDLPDLN